MGEVGAVLTLATSSGQWFPKLLNTHTQECAYIYFIQIFAVISY